MINKRMLTFVSLVYIEFIFLVIISKGNWINFNIDTEIVPTLPIHDSAGTIETYISTEAETNNNNNVDLNKIYYQQRLSLAKNQAKQTQAKIPEQPQQQTQTPQPQTPTQQTQPTKPKRRVIDTTQYQYLISSAESWINTPYVWGGTTREGVDCSGFVQQLYKSFGVSLPRTSEEQSIVGLLVSRNELLPGDLLFFDTDTRDTTKLTHVSHVGLYVGNGKMIHAGSGNGVVEYTNIETTYYRSRFMNARRILVPKIKEE